MNEPYEPPRITEIGASQRVVCKDHGTFVWAAQVEPYCPVCAGETPDPADPTLAERG